MNQNTLFNDDLKFNEAHDAWCFTALISAQLITIYVHSSQLKSLINIDSCTKFDLEEIVELWLEQNEIDGEEIHLNIC